jgi:hypothetical protein
VRSPLAVRVGNKHVTQRVSGLTWRKEAVGGLKSISFRVGSALDAFDPDFAALSKVYIQDGRSAVTIAEGRLTDPSRGAGSDGQVWDMTAFGPAEHASDVTFSYILIDQSVTDGWRRTDSNAAGGTNGTGPPPDDATDNVVEGMVLQFPAGIPIATNSRITMRYERLRESGQKLGGFTYTADCGVTDAGYHIRANTSTDAGNGETPATATFSTTPASPVRVVVTHFPTGRNILDFLILRGGGATNVATDTIWGYFGNVCVRALLLDKDGTEVTGIYGLPYMIAHNVVNDLLGRVLTQFDGANATVDTNGTYQIDQMAYPDGVTAEQVLADLMAQAPAYYWTTGPSNSSGKYTFTWKPWPTTVRYEVTINGGGSFPTSTQELYNRVMVRWRNAVGQIKTTIRTMACAALDNATPPIVRQALLDLGDEAGSLAAAQQAGDAFLADHNVPPNAGTLTISSPIWDNVLRRMVEPFEIEPAELIRVRGIESYPNALNASSSDGLTVFRIWAMTYNGDDDTANLELDSYSRTEINALTALTKQRSRKR